MSISNLLTDPSKPWQNLNINSIDFNTASGENMTINILNSGSANSNSLNVENIQVINNGSITPVSGVLNINGSESVLGDIRFLKAIFPVQGGAHVLGGFWTQNNSITISNTTETSLFGSGTINSTRTMPPNSLQIGSAFQVQFLGNITTSSNKVATIRFKVNNITVSSTTVTIDNTSGISSSFNFDGYFTFRSTGVSGSAVYNTIFGFLDTFINKGFDSFGTIACNTLIPNTIDVTWQWSAAGGVSSITSSQSFIRTLA